MAPAAAKKIICNTTVEGAGEWYGSLVNTNISYEDGSPVTINEFLGVKFKSPPVTAGITVNAQLSPWQQTSSEISTDLINDTTIGVTAKVIVETTHTFQASDRLVWGINGNLTTDPDTWIASFELYADELPSGIVEVQCADAPDSDLQDNQQTVTLQQGSVPTPLSAVPGKTSSFTVVAGDYTVSASELSNDTQTTVAAAQVTPEKITVTTGETTTLKVTYGAATKYSAINVTVGQLSSPIDKERLHVRIADTSSGKVLEDFFSANNHTTELRRLPTSGEVDIEAQVTLNNVKYDYIKTISLSHNLIEVEIDESDVKSSKVDTSDFVDLPVTLQADFKLSDASVPVRLISSSSDVIYAQDIPVSGDQDKFTVPVAPGEYTVEVTGFVTDSTVYAVQGPSTLTVAKNGSTTLELTARRGANLEVHGFPNYLSFGALSDLSDPDGRDFIAAHVTSIFKYAGNDGAGDSGSYLADDPATTRTIQLAAKVESEIGGDLTVLPILISYTVNLSLGGTEAQLHNEKGLAHSFGNLILSLQLAKKYGKESVPAGYIINPDFLGECQKGPSGNGFSPDYSMPVRTPLEEALAHRSVEAKIPDFITDTLKGYVLAVNWLIRTVAEKVTFGWQANLWGVGSAAWIYNKDPNAPAVMAKKTADYIKTLAVYDSDYRPDFLAVDRYEADDFTQRAYVNSYCYGPYEWGRFFEFCGYLSLELQVSLRCPLFVLLLRIAKREPSVLQHWGKAY